MTDRIDPGPGWRLLEVGEIKRAGDEYFFEEWKPTERAGDKMDGSSCPVRRRVLPPDAIKAIATRATVRGELPGGAIAAHSVERKAGLTPEQMAFASEQWELANKCLPESGAKYIMLEIQREGES